MPYTGLWPKRFGLSFEDRLRLVGIAPVLLSIERDCPRPIFFPCFSQSTCDSDCPLRNTGGVPVK